MPPKRVILHSTSLALLALALIVLSPSRASALFQSKNTPQSAKTQSERSTQQKRKLPPRYISKYAKETFIKFSVCGIRKKTGIVILYVFNKAFAKSYPYKTSNAVFKTTLSALDAINTCTSKTIPKNFITSSTKYAAYAFHDANANGIPDLNVFGIPKEKYGFSGNVDLGHHRPEFQYYAFTVSKDQDDFIVINLK